MTPPETKILAVDETGAQPLPDAPQGGTVLLLHSPGGRDDGWSGRAAVALSRGWRDQGRRILLCDASMEAPQLHKAAGVPNAEGISDALRFGTSLKRVARRLEANLFLATAGSVAFDAGSLRESPRWDTFTAGFAEAGALLVLFAPVDGDSVDALVRRADLVYVLASPGETISVDYLGGEPTAILTRSDRDDPALLLDKEDASVAGSMEWDESADDDSADNESPMDDQGDSEEAEDDSDAGSVGPDDQARLRRSRLRLRSTASPSLISSPRRITRRRMTRVITTNRTMQFSTSARSHRTLMTSRLLSRRKTLSPPRRRRL